MNPGIKNKKSRNISEIKLESLYSEETEKQPQFISSPLIALMVRAIIKTIRSDDRIIEDVFIYIPEIKYKPDIISNQGKTNAKA